MKKIFFVFVLLGLFFAGFFISASDLEDTSENIQSELEDAKENIDSVKEFGDKEKWEYLSNEWKDMLLQNKLISGLDSFFKKINFVFIFLFGEDYELSLILFFVIILWGFFTYYFYQPLKNYSLFSRGISLILSFLFSILLAHINIFHKLSELIFKIVFYKEGIYSWIFFIGALFLLGVFAGFMRYIGFRIKKYREKTAKEKETLDRKILHGTVENVKKLNEAAAGK